MNKTAVLLAAWLFCMSYVAASNVLAIEDVSLRQGGVATIAIGCEFDTQFKGYQFDLELNGDLTLVLDHNDKPVWYMGFDDTDHTVSCTVISESKYRFVCVSTSNTPLPTNGVLLKLKVTGSETMSVGDTFEGNVKAIEFTTLGTEVCELPDASFDITIINPRIILDENSTEVPEQSEENAKVKVRRTINANEWNTICLPFDMTEAQVYEAFGDDVQLAEYIDHEMNNEATEITVNFDDANLSEDGLMANNPYIIKTSKDITEFTADGVTIDPDEEGSVAEYTNGRSGSQKVVNGAFKGTYHAQTVVPENCLFLSDNEFWYSKGLTKMKAFRAWFDFVDVLASVEDAPSRISISFVGDTATGIHEIKNRQIVNSEFVDLQGRRVSVPDRGLYIVEGRKIVIK